MNDYYEYKYPDGCMVGSDSLRMERINESNIVNMKDTDFAYERYTKYLKECSGTTEGFLFYTGWNECVGYLWVMYKGGRHQLYKVTSEATIHSLCVFAAQRGKGYAGEMKKSALYYLKNEKKITDVHEIIRHNNFSAMQVQEKMEVPIVRHRIWIRIMGIHIPKQRL